MWNITACDLPTSLKRQLNNFGGTSTSFSAECACQLYFRQLYNTKQFIDNWIFHPLVTTMDFRKRQTASGSRFWVWLGGPKELCIFRRGQDPLMGRGNFGGMGWPK